MDRVNVTIKRLCLYVIGLFILSSGVSFSIEAGLGVSPVSSLPYAIALTSGLSVGMMTGIINVFFIFVSAIMIKRFDLWQSIMQFIIAFLFGLFVDLTLFLAQQLPTPETIAMRWGFLTISLFLVATGLLVYMRAQFPLLPYDGFTKVISDRFNIKFSIAKISTDSFNVGLAGVICLIFIQSLGSVGLGTIVAAYFVGKILGWIRYHFEQPLERWIYKESAERATLKQEKTSLT